MKTERVYLLFFFLLFTSTRAQELYIHTEAASTMPKGVLGIRAYTETYKEVTIPRNMTAFRVMYGVSKKLTVWVQGTASNHHDTILPKDIVTHTHVGNQTIFYTQNRVYGRKYPYRFNGLSFYAKYRLLSLDGQNKHFRVAAYAESARMHSAHDEAEPDLVGDNSGYGCGLIVTQLYKRLAVTLNTGYVRPLPYSEISGINHIQLYYGNALSYNLSFGYLLYPKKYRGYDQDNYNVYVELMGKAYKTADLVIDNETIAIQSTSLKAGHYVEGRFGVQRIVRSNDRLDLSVGVPLYNQSYVRFYPVYTVGWQRYFYFNKRKQQQELKALLEQRAKQSTEQIIP